MTQKVHVHATKADLGLVSQEAAELVRKAQAGDAVDQTLTVKQAVKKYKKAVFWALALSLCLVMDGYDVVVITSFYGQPQFQRRFGSPIGGGAYAISAAWQSGLSNSSVVGQLFGLTLSGYLADRIGPRKTTMGFLVWMAASIFATFFAPNLQVLAFGLCMCGIGWGSFQTTTTTYASEVVPTVLRPYVTAWVCMCWGLGILISSLVVKAVENVEGELAYRLPFALQWVWPLPLFIATYLAPESPWSSVRRDRIDEARHNIRRLRQVSTTTDEDVEASLALIIHTTEIERAESAGATYLDCFKGIALRRTEINCVVWAAQILCGNAILGFAVVFLQQAGFTASQAFSVNIALSSCYIIGGLVCWGLMARLGRATIYMSGMTIMFVLCIVIGGLGCAPAGNKAAQLGIGITLVINTLVNMITIGPSCYPIVAETPSGRLRYKTIVIGRFVYNLTGIFSNSVTPRMVNPVAAGGWGWGAKVGFFYAGTNLLCNIWCWFRLPETKDRTFGEIDVLFENKVPARKFRTTKADQFVSESDNAEQTVDEEKAKGDHVEFA